LIVPCKQPESEAMIQGIDATMMPHDPYYVMLPPTLGGFGNKMMG
jgi:hypothetical protein